jgi:hypothetical protein
MQDLRADGAHEIGRLGRGVAEGGHQNQRDVG